MQENRCQNLDFEVFRARFQILNKGFQSPISNFKRGFQIPIFEKWAPKWQNFDEKTVFKLQNWNFSSTKSLIFIRCHTLRSAWYRGSGRCWRKMRITFSCTDESPARAFWALRNLNFWIGSSYSSRISFRDLKIQIQRLRFGLNLKFHQNSSRQNLDFVLGCN